MYLCPIDMYKRNLLHTYVFSVTRESLAFLFVYMGLRLWDLLYFVGFSGLIKWNLIFEYKNVAEINLYVIVYV